MNTSAGGDRFRRSDGMIELRLVATRLRRTTLAIWGLILAVVVAGLFTVDASDRLGALISALVLVVGTAAFVLSARRIALLIDGDRIGWRSGWSSGGKWWVDLDDVREIQLDAHRPMERTPVRSYILYSTEGGMPSREAFAIGHVSAPGRAEMRERIGQGFRPFVIRMSDLGDERAAVVDALLEPHIRSKGRTTRWS